MTTTPFAIRTSDTAWIKRNHAVAGEAGRVIVQVPAGQVRKITRCGQPWLSHRFTDVPADALNPSISCPAAWVEAPEVTAQRPEALSGKALFLANARAAGAIR